MSERGRYLARGYLGDPSGITAGHRCHTVSSVAVSNRRERGWPDLMAVASLRFSLFSGQRSKTGATASKLEEDK